MPNTPPQAREAVMIVSGLPRSGTSMAMRMLAAAGIPLLTDALRPPDEDNPLGYFELEAVKKTRDDPSWLADAPGKAVKVIHALLQCLPPTHHYRIIFMHRDLDEVLASQRRMLERSGRLGASMPPEALKRVFASQLQSARRWAETQPNCACLDVHYHEVIHAPAAQAARMASFAGIPDKAAEMAAAVDASLYRRRRQVPGQ
ncbi:MAG: sulfotransferase [Phycisphaeraceae bacterium]|nr:sulfotransferase [Phycisphaeraceae bacterium]